MGDINENWSLTLKKSNDSSYSEHHIASYGCEYKESPGDWYITGTRFHVRNLIRVCYCGRYENRKKMLERKSIKIYEYDDGVELHVEEDCKYNPKRIPVELQRYESTGSLQKLVQHDRYCSCQDKILPVAQR
jgi:hypothetical protein